MAVLGVELGSTRIKGVLIDQAGNVLAAGAHDWENRFENGIWTYDLEDAHKGLQDVIAQLRSAAPSGEAVEAIGISAMMHGYLVFDQSDQQLCEFRTWRNTMTEQAAAALSEAFAFNMPQRWSGAHLYQAILNGESHVQDIAHITTLAGYIHYKLTGEKVLGIGDASGMFPINGMDFDAGMIQTFESMAADKGITLRLKDIFPRVISAGAFAGKLTDGGAQWLGASGWIMPGTPVCPPEGDAGTGMVATNSIAPRTGNVSAGTSIFAMAVLEKPLKGVYPEIDIVTTPTGSPVAMVHCNNGTSDLDAWIGLFGEVLQAAGAGMEKSALYTLLYESALSAQPNAGGLLNYNYLAGEHIAGLDAGMPLFMRLPNAALTMGNFIRCLLFSSVATLKLGMDILTGRENVRLSYINGHGGLFKTKRVGQKILADALGVPVRVPEQAGEGGAWGIAVLAGFLIWRGQEESLAQYLDTRIFIDRQSTTEQPDEKNSSGFADYMKNYTKGLGAEHSAVKLFC